MCWCLLSIISSYCVLTSCLPELSWYPDRSTGEVWPLPRYISYKESLNTINPLEFYFKITNETCDILEEAVQRYIHVVTSTLSHSLDQDKNKICKSQEGTLSFAEVRLDSPCESWPHFKMDEHYELHINTADHEQKAVISSSSVWGILRGLETFSQLVYPSPEHPGCLTVNSTDILDFPRFPHRGLLLDTSRHYIPVPVIFNILSAMEMNKMNVFHWHIVDDQSFPYQSYTFPSLSNKGAYDPTKLVYTQQKIRDVLEFARLRGIRVLPEFDSPGHTLSWGKGVRKLLTPCFANGSFSGEFGPVDPSRSKNYKFMQDLLEEVKHVFPDSYIHLGGDEVPFDCWESNPDIKRFMEEKNITTYEGLESYYINKVLQIVKNLNGNAIVWQEVFFNNVTLANDTVVHLWLGNPQELLAQVISHGHYALLSAGWYLDHLEDQWQTFYANDPSTNLTTPQNDLILGGEACMWGEMVDETNVVPRIWPRASAVAERLWSKKGVNSIRAAAPRINEHVCRMKRRGVPASPANGPGFCPY